MNHAAPDATERDVPVFGGVPDVPDVPAKQDAISCGTSPERHDVLDVPEPEPRGVADLVAGATRPQLSIPAKERPCFRVFDEKTYVTEQGHDLKPGTWYFGIKAAKGKDGDSVPIYTEQWICGPLHIQAQTCDAHGNSYGRLLRFRTTRKTWRTLAMPMELLRGSGEDLRGELLDAGLVIDPNQRSLLNKYLCAMTPHKRVSCTTQTGWCEGAYVLPREVIGPNAEGVIYQGARDAGESEARGTLADWQRDVSAYAVGNPLLTLAIASAFAGPILERCNAESGGIHLTGHSSSGKTTSIECAVSVWGSPKYRGSWRATSNGLEGVSALRNDGLLALDEIHEADPREVGAVVYMVANGKGKQRAGRTGAARPAATWRCVLLSSGERTLATTLAEAGQRQTAGQGVRLLDIPVPDTAAAVFENPHGFADGRELADHLKAAVKRQHGTAIRAFLEHFASDQDDMAPALDTVRGMLATAGMDGQELRAAGRFALFALAGELATGYGITGWPEGESIEAACRGFAAWRDLRGKGRDERRQVIEALAQFIERHGDSRFSEEGVSTHEVVRDRAGWWTSSADVGRVYLFTTSGMREALRGFDLRRALDMLVLCKVIPAPTGSGERAQPATVNGQKVRVYRVHHAALEAARGHL